MTGGGAREDDTQNGGYDWRGNKPAIVALSFSHTETKDAEQFYNKKVRKRSKIKIMTLCIFVHIFNLCLVITFNHLLYLIRVEDFQVSIPLKARSIFSGIESIFTPSAFQTEFRA